MKVSVYLKKCSSETSNICFRVRDKNVDIKVVSPLEVQDRYWDSDTLSYRRTTAVPAVEQKRLPGQIAAIIERAENTFTDKAATFSILKYFPAGHFLICIKQSYQPVSGLRFQDSSPKKKPHESEEPSGRSEGVRTPDADNVRKQNAGCGHPLYVGK